MFLNMNSLRSIIIKLLNFKTVNKSGNFPRGGAFEQLFGPARGDLNQKFKFRGVAPGGGGDVEASI